MKGDHFTRNEVASNQTSNGATILIYVEPASAVESIPRQELKERVQKIINVDVKSLTGRGVLHAPHGKLTSLDREENAVFKFRIPDAFGAVSISYTVYLKDGAR